ncbi:DNA internalization-related competence protein ComEC/Rec2 [Ottowia sp. GY511]|uniref:DNA internalization-related competence protein ComEC/Rec2 n=1 Tax=Ottowia flava TaxID=2675430 RepID=A0ABW4KQX0_9BURK|nr:DNA internalization-related competence protein ComEC/Rec2 [Ottowia sp. GY511]TXK28296.1 DNA internalization-related competence protein ComEC/Rec2 [Ottowia sp. GY511]
MSAPAQHANEPGSSSVAAVARTAWLLPAALAGWIAGTALQLQQRDLWGLAAYALLAVAALLSAAGAVWVVVRWRRHVLPVTALAAISAALLAFALTGGRATQLPPIGAALEGVDLQLTGVVARMPQLGEQGTRFFFDVVQATQDGRPVAVPPRLLIGWYRDGGGFAPTAPGTGAALPELHAGERWRFTARLKAAHGNFNPHGFDYELWLWEQGVRATGYVRAGASDTVPQRLASGEGHAVERLRQAVRDRIMRTAAPSADPAAQRRAAVVAALLTGDQALIERGDWDLFRTTGVAHLMSISGLHITMFAWLAAAVVGWAWRRSARWSSSLRWPARFNPCLRWPAPHAALVGGVALAAAYALFSGWGVPAQRTVLMLATVAALRVSGLRWPWWLTWLLACALVLAWDPWAWLQAGFWLSFVAVGVLFATDSGAGSADGYSAGGRFVQLLREQWVVTLALTPLSLLLFGQASVVGLLANLLAIPWVTVLVTPLAVLGVLWAPLWQAAAWALQPLIALLQWLAAWPGASVAVAQAPLVLGAAAVAGGLMLALPWPWQLRVVGLPLLAPLLLWQPARPAPGQFELLAADVGQGNAVLLRTATHSLVYDAGPRYSLDSDAGDRVLLPLLRALGERVDTLVLSHRDSDHTGGAAALLTGQPQAAVLSSLEADHPLRGVRPVLRCLTGQHWDWDGVRFEVLHPTPALYDAKGLKPNALSCVLRVRAAGGAGALLVGDIEAAQELSLVHAHGAGLHAEVLLVPHHGSRTSSTPEFIDAVAPRWAWVQSGYRNRFGHPAAPVLARYAERGIAVVDSPHCGAMHWRSAQPGALGCERALRRRYWQHQLP